MIYDENCFTYCGMHAEVVKYKPDFQKQPIKYVATFSKNKVSLALLFSSFSFVYINKKDFLTASHILVSTQPCAYSVDCIKTVGIR